MFCGIDWAESHHDVALVGQDGQLLAKRRINDDLAGYRLLLDLLAEHGDSPETPIPVAIETSSGLLVAALRTGKRKIFAVNPLAAARHRDRHGVSRKKSDPGDALVLANILRTDRHAHRPLPDDIDLARAITVLARAQQDAVRARQQIANQVRSLLRDYYPVALDAFLGKQGGLTRPEARAVLALAPTPSAAAQLTLPRLRADPIADLVIAGVAVKKGQTPGAGMPAAARCPRRRPPRPPAPTRAAADPAVRAAEPASGHREILRLMVGESESKKFSA